MASVRAVRAASQEQLTEQLLGRLAVMLRCGTTTVEVTISAHPVDSAADVVAKTAFYCSSPVASGEQEKVGVRRRRRCLPECRKPDQSVLCPDDDYGRSGAPELPNGRLHQLLLRAVPVRPLRVRFRDMVQRKAKADVGMQAIALHWENHSGYGQPAKSAQPDRPRNGVDRRNRVVHEH